MDEILLTEEQMRELESVGFDISDAKVYKRIETADDICREVSFNSYSITDILRKLPRTIQPFLNVKVCIANGNNADSWRLRICPFTDKYWSVSYIMDDYNPCHKDCHRDDYFHSTIGITLLEALFNMLKWLKEEETRDDRVKYFKKS